MRFLLPSHTYMIQNNIDRVYILWRVVKGLGLSIDRSSGEEGLSHVIAQEIKNVIVGRENLNV